VLNPKENGGGGANKAGWRTVAMDQNPSLSPDGIVDKPLGPIPYKTLQSHAGGWLDTWIHSRWEIPNEILFLRVSEIHDKVSEVIREAWFDRECLFRVSNANAVGRASGRAKRCSTELVNPIAS